MEEKIQMTQEGYDLLKKEYDDLVHNVRPEVVSDLAAARAQGDLSENADYDAARDRQAKVESRINEIDAMLQNAEIIKISTRSSKSVKMGSTVTYTDLSRNTQETFLIVSTVEADPMKGKLSSATPLGSALLDHKVGDVVDVLANRPYQVKIEKIA